MDSSSGNSSGSLLFKNSESDEDRQKLMKLRKRKRMDSNRESARRSRMKKRRHLDDLLAQITQIRKENNQILSNLNLTTQHYFNVEAENTVLRVQMVELAQRLLSLDEILIFLSTNNGGFEAEMLQKNVESFVNPFNLLYSNQPVTVSSDFLHC